ncbi:MAG: CRTAC1 family protein [Actinomycetota bacterium]
MLVAVAVALAAAACGDGDDPAAPADGPVVDAEVRTVAFAERACSGGFVAHDLDHVTAPRGEVEAMVDGTGAGVLADDLDGDGDIDLVLPDLVGATNVWWNDGAGELTPELVAEGRFRQAVAADVDADGTRDLVLTTGIGPPQVYLRAADGTGWTRTELRDLRLVTFSIAPGDLEGDGDLDLAVGSYNAELTAARDPRAISGIDVGSAVYRSTGGLSFDEELLSPSAQALVTLLVDLDGDGADDVVAGNDLGTPDRIWLGGPRGLTFTELFDTTTLSTMSIDVADIDNDGDRDVIATDMAPMEGAPLDAWADVFADIEAARVDDIQQPENALQLAGDDGYTQVARARGIDATGWSWSGVTGDLDEDGRLDLYVVNGMQGTAIFDTLPDGELVEANQVFRNAGDGFEPRPDWGLGDDAGGRGMAQADLDGDGDLDVVINNLGSPSRWYENQLCGGTAVVVEPLWPAAQNLDALGATVVVDDGDVVRERIITGARGYLSTSQTRAHVGLGDGGPVDVTVRWPDGATTQLDDVDPGELLVVERTEAAVTTEEAP